MVDAPEKIWATFEPHESGKGHPRTYATAARTKGQEYVRADLHAELEAENERLRQSIVDLALSLNSLADNQVSELEAENARLRKALDALDRMSRGVDWCDQDEQARRWSAARRALEGDE